MGVLALSGSCVGRSTGAPASAAPDPDARTAATAKAIVFNFVMLVG